MRPNQFNELYTTAVNLLEQGHMESCVHILLQAKLGLENQSEWELIKALIEKLPESLLYSDANVALLYAKTHRCLRSHKRTVELYRSYWFDMDFERAKLECAASFNGLGMYEEALILLEEIIPKLAGEDLGLAWSRYGFAAFNLNQPWEEAYKNATSILSGEELGRVLLNKGYSLSMSGRDEEAHGVWLEALSHFKRNTYFSIWIRYNLATIAMNNLDPNAERHLLSAIHDVRSPKTEILQSKLWSGLGRFRGSLGEWRRAEFSYQQAVNSAQGSYDRQTAYRGLTRNQYLSGQLDQALETLEVALHEPDVPHFLLYVVQAKVYLKLGQTNKAKAVLEKAGEPKFELEKWPWSIAAAELARQEGRFDEAVTLLEGLPLNNVDARADVRQFPLLFELLHGAGKPMPEPLEYVQGTTIAVQAQGVLHVSVNGRRVDIIPTGRVGELLVFLLEQGGQASLEAIGDALYPDVTEAKRRRQAVWKLVDKLREALGWQDAVLSLRGAYQLDPKATWHYDIAEARRRKEFGGEFLAGVYSEWALEVGRELQELGPAGRRLLN